jgi:hypothetical protein
MATLSELELRGDIWKMDPALPPREQEERAIFASPALLAWIANVLPGLGSTWNIEMSPIEQLDVLVGDFCAGHELTYKHHFKPLLHKLDGIWELKTADLRVFGWFPVKDHFLAVKADLADRVKISGLYNGYCGEVDRFRTALELDDPKHIQGIDPNGVVSNYSYP